MTESSAEPQESGILQKKRYPEVAFLLSLCVPGLGQVYGGKADRGLVLTAISWVFFAVVAFLGRPFQFLGLCAFLLLGMGVLVGVASDAAILARKTGSIQLRPYNRWYAYLAIVLVWELLAAPIILLSLQLGQAKVEIVDASSSSENPWLELAEAFAERQVRTFEMPATSMEPTLKRGDYLIASLNSYRDKLPERGDIIIFYYPEDRSKFFTKRVIGIEGETVEIRDKKVFIDGEPLNDPWAVHGDPAVLPGGSYPRDNMKPVLVPEGSIFVLGDNRDFSFDSRFWGFVDKQDLRGKALYIYWSEDLSRIGTQIK